MPTNDMQNYYQQQDDTPSYNQNNYMMTNLQSSGINNHGYGMSRNINRADTFGKA